MGHLCLTFIPLVARKFTFYQLTAVCPALSFRHQISENYENLDNTDVFGFSFVKL